MSVSVGYSLQKCTKLYELKSDLTWVTHLINFFFYSRPVTEMLFCGRFLFTNFVVLVVQEKMCMTKLCMTNEFPTHVSRIALIVKWEYCQSLPNVLVAGQAWEDAVPIVRCMNVVVFCAVIGHFAYRSTLWWFFVYVNDIVEVMRGYYSAVVFTAHMWIKK